LASGRGKSGLSTRRAARLAAVQALYQMDLGGEAAPLVVEEFIAHRLGREIEGVKARDVDTDWFADVVRGVGDRRAEVDAAIGGCLDKDREIGRLEMVMRALLRAAAYELVARIDVPARVVINEYVDVAHAFFTGNEPSFANGVLDRLARRLRADEMSGGAGGPAARPR